MRAIVVCAFFGVAAALRDVVRGVTTHVVVREDASVDPEPAENPSSVPVECDVDDIQCRSLLDKIKTPFMWLEDAGRWVRDRVASATTSVLPAAVVPQPAVLAQPGNVSQGDSGLGLTVGGARRDKAKLKTKVCCCYYKSKDERRVEACVFPRHNLHSTSAEVESLPVDEYRTLSACWEEDVASHGSCSAGFWGGKTIGFPGECMPNDLYPADFHKPFPVGAKLVYARDGSSKAWAAERSECLARQGRNMVATVANPMHTAVGSVVASHPISELLPLNSEVDDVTEEPRGNPEMVRD